MTLNKVIAGALSRGTGGLYLLNPK